MSNYYTYTFVRLDLPMSQRIIQHGHACHNAAVALGACDVATPNIVLFEVADETELVEVSKKLRLLGIGFEMFYERDHDQGFSALATLPIFRDDEKRKSFEGYRLYDAPLNEPHPAVVAS